MSTMSKRGSGQDNIAPGQIGRTDIGYENLQVKLLHYPTYEEFAQLVSKASVAVKGSIIEDNEIDDAFVSDIFKGGLNQCLEWMTVVFEVSGVSRGVTHQLVRTRKASFAQQSMRYADMGSFNARMPVAIDEFPGTHGIAGQDYPLLWKLSAYGENTAAEVWEKSVEIAREAYAWLAEHGVPMQDARTVCPIATETYIICEYPLSEFLATYSYRACSMFYPETVALFRLMGQELAKYCPWIAPQIKISCEKTSGGINGLPHKCTYQGWERVEGQCNFEWALEENRTFKSTKVKE